MSLRSILPDLTPFAESPAFMRMWIGTLLSGIGSQMTVMTVGIEIFAITQSTFMVGLTGAFTLVPTLFVGIYGGTWVDRFDRRKVGLIAAVIGWASTAVIALHSWLGFEWVWLLYAMSGINAAAFAVLSTARSSILPRLLKPSTVPAALALNGIEMGAMITIGPALGGILVHSVGYQWTYTFDVLLFCSMFLGLYSLPAVAPTTTGSVTGWRSVIDGFRYLKTSMPLMMGFILDMAAMMFGSPRVLFPAIGAVILGGGSLTVGWLTAATAIGTLVCGLLSGRLSHFYAHGRAVVISVICYTLALLGFGVVLLVAAMSPIHSSSAVVGSIPLLAAALICLAISGAADNVSMIYRNTIATVGVRDEVRGRVQGMYIVSVTAGPRLGDLYAGIVAGLVTVWFPPVLGVLLTFVVLGIAIRLAPGYLRYHAVEPKSAGG